MKIKIEKISNQYTQIYFTFLKEEINQFYIMATNNITKQRNNKDEDVDSQEIRDYVINSIEDIIEEEIYNYDVIPIGFKNYQYFMELKKDEPMIVLVQFITLPLEDFKLVFPTSIEPKKVLPKDFEKNYQQLLDNIMIANGYTISEESDIVTMESEVKYDLVYEENGYTIKTIKDQYINLIDEEELPKEKFLNAKVGDRIIIDQDKVDVVAVIKNIYEEKPVGLNKNIVSEFEFANTKTVIEFKEKVKNVLFFSHLVNNTITVLLDSIADKIDLEIDQYALMHHSKFSAKDSDDDLVTDVKNMIIYQYLMVFIASMNKNISEKNMNLIADEYELYNLSDYLSEDEEDFEFFSSRRIHEVLVYEYCLETKILSI